MKRYIRSAINSLPDEPDDVRREVAKSSSAYEGDLEQLSSDPDWRTRRYATNNPNMPIEHLVEMAKSKDGRVRREAALSKLTPPEVLATLVNDRAPRVRLAVAKNPNTTLEMLERLVQDSDEFVRLAAISHPKADPLVTKLYNSTDGDIRRHIASNIHTNPEILAKMVDIEPAAIAGNPSTPIKILEKLSKSEKPYVLEELSSNSSTPSNILRTIYNSSKQYPGVLHRLAFNQNTPVDILQEMANSEYRGLASWASETLTKLHQTW